MKIEYDPTRDLLYVWFAQEDTIAARTETVAPGVHADFDAKRKLIGLEVLDASEVLGRKVEFEMELPVAQVEAVARAA
ncbi:MAG: hypothetical protein AUJ92_03285 [Armatimonadetes bacterium CG2_30_59_28]|nr:DUF2283 domain-containing protein [Armatimonadota bacterium]OIO97598.1 MAG: hypothetical protein AUJ92_03285 [Armatimonadetes bacterium CG2_30_59_28]PIU66072.1 MAG: hypothetical protein COS85_06195 [Armatimonadetes bacterium CG07_land_8_20_14_0_80_59_28]PIX38372.1 MAG: hypothetical protein COZ56_20620 [Armatimonadetes bacterium CG_4_8_14_3_um_filter_58_9]PIY45798.1 MAG: hypothetical protein COZ05_06220 [Armatimonadetes bacterium CG_4_10_14_3_um_filter_59_10]